MGGPGSGRHGGARDEGGTFIREERGPHTRPCPRLEHSHESCRNVAAWVCEQVAAGTIDNKPAETLLSAVAKMTASLRSDYQERELEEMREILRQMKAATGDIAQRENLGRGAASGNARPPTGRTKVTDVA